MRQIGKKKGEKVNFPGVESGSKVCDSGFAWIIQIKFIDDLFERFKCFDLKRFLIQIKFVFERLTVFPQIKPSR